MHKDTAIRLQNISKVYKLYDKPIDRLKESLHPFKKKYHKDFYALKDINLEIKKGEVLGIVGVNGAGKSTLLKIISGVLTPTSGRVNIHGRVNAILELGAGLKPEMTGRENIRLHIQINGIETDRDRIIREIIEFADMNDFIDQPVKTYSSGMKSRLGFALATSLEPELLIVDEALAVGDISFKLKSYAKMESLMRNGCTVIYVSHDLQSVIHLCNRAILIMNGEIIADGKPQQIVEMYQQKVFSKKNHLKVIHELHNSDIRKKSNYKKAFLSEELIPKPKILQNRNVKINDIKILDMDAEIVNILITDQQYTISFDVVYDEPFSNMMFGIEFKTLNGIYLYGIRDQTQSKTNIEKGDIINFQFEFANSFLPGSYYLNIGAASSINGEVEYLILHTEAYPFKVVNYNANKLVAEYGIVHLDGHCSIHKTKG